MADTPALLDGERTAQTTPQTTLPIRPDTPALPGTLRLVAAPGPAVTAKPAPAPATPADRAVFQPAVRRPRRHAYVAARCYDIGVAILLLLSAAVALYRLVWMGQP